MTIKAPRVPTHRIDAPAVYVWADEAETAWDWDRIHAEVEEDAKAWRVENEMGPEDSPDAPDHPCHRYWRGETRFDLSAEMDYRGETVTVLDYLGDRAHTRFVLHRLGDRDMTEIDTLSTQLGRSGYPKIARLALRRGLAKVENLPGFKLTHTAGLVSEKSMTALRRIGGRGMLYDVANAITRLSEGPTEAEKKA